MVYPATPGLLRLEVTSDAPPCWNGDELDPPYRGWLLAPPAAYLEALGRGARVAGRAPRGRLSQGLPGVQALGKHWSMALPERLGNPVFDSHLPRTHPLVADAGSGRSPWLAACRSGESNR